MVAPWLARAAIAEEGEGGWPGEVKAPSAIPFDEHHCVPSAMTLEDTEEFEMAWVAALKRARKAGFDVIEIHNAHGYLLHSFLSPVSNARTDRYGGSWEHRTRLTREIVELTRANMPDTMPLFLRISATDWLECEGWVGDSWKVEDSARLAVVLAEKGVDLLDVSSGANHPAQKIKVGPGYQAPFAEGIKRAVGDKLFIGSVGMITGEKQTKAILTGKGAVAGQLEKEGKGGKEEEDLSMGEEELDLVIVARAFLKIPGLVWQWADELGVQIKVANQIGWVIRGARRK